MSKEVSTQRRENLQYLLNTRDNGVIQHMADRLKKGHSQVSQLLGRGQKKKNMGGNIAREVEEVYGLPRGAMDSPLQQDQVAETPEAYGEEPSLTVPLFDVVGAAGIAGKAVPEHETVIDNLRLSMTWVRKNLSVTNPHNLSFITAFGDSMAPTFTDGDILLVDRGVTEIRLDAVYAVAVSDELFIKRVQRRPNGEIIIKSDNPLYDPYTVSNGDRADVRVLGRIIWAWNGRRL